MNKNIDEDTVDLVDEDLSDDTETDIEDSDDNGDTVDNRDNEENDVEVETEQGNDKDEILKIEKTEYEENECIYNDAENESDNETEIIFDDDNNGSKSDIVPSDLKISRPFLTKYERNRIKGDRIQQLTLGAKPLIKNCEHLTPKEIAELEIENNIIPLIIERPLPDGTKERWYIGELKH
jgi:DNA-directed RNA polymerase subunit K/omega